MKGNLNNLNDLVAGTVVKMSNGKFGVVRFLMGEIVLIGGGGEICQARICIAAKGSESYATYRRDGISHQGHSYDIENIVKIGDGVDLSDKEARLILTDIENEKG
jgi:hypothetical protein